MSAAELFVWALSVAAVLYLVSPWWQRWKNKRARKRFADAERKKWEAHRRELDLPGRYRRWDEWLRKIKYFKRKPDDPNKDE
jgi:type VI protein secretion system component VasK